MVTGERIQEKGRRGAHLARLWLDHTGRVRIDFDAYNWPDHVVLPPVAGPSKAFDLAGHLLNEDGHVAAPLYVEVKNADTEGSQKSQYKRYLANCYSVTAKAIQDDGLDRACEFMWATWHPFWITEWPDLTSKRVIREAVEEHQDEILDGRDVEDDLIELLSHRCWVIVLGRRHHELSMSAWMLGEVRKAIVNRMQP